MADDSTGYKLKVELPVFKPLPYRMMLPRPIGNLICAGRLASAERHVMGLTREIGPSMAMGEAAGIAAQLSIHGKSCFSDININQLSDRLRQRGCIIDREDLPESTQRNDFHE